MQYIDLHTSHNEMSAKFRKSLENRKLLNRILTDSFTLSMSMHTIMHKLQKPDENMLRSWPFILTGCVEKGTGNQSASGY